jgi:hypothetical protein
LSDDALCADVFSSHASRLWKVWARRG